MKLYAHYCMTMQHRVLPRRRGTSRAHSPSSRPAADEVRTRRVDVVDGQQQALNGAGLVCGEALPESRRRRCAPARPDALAPGRARAGYSCVAPPVTGSPADLGQPVAVALQCANGTIMNPPDLGESGAKRLSRHPAVERQAKEQVPTGRITDE